MEYVTVYLGLAFGLFVPYDFYLLKSYYTVPGTTSLEPCTLATPTVDYTEHGHDWLAADSGANSMLPATEGSAMRIGYIKTLSVFDYVGCVASSDVQHNVSNPGITYGTPRDLGQCYSACGTEYFGVHRTSCYCFGKNFTVGIATRQPWCDSSCDAPVSTACGGRHEGQEYISVYKLVPDGEKGVSDTNYCRIYNKTAESFAWATCGDRRGGLCNLGFATDSGPWNRYSQLCFRAGQSPMSESEDKLRSVKGSDSWQLWIGRVKAWTIIKTEDATAEDLKFGYHGYIRWTGGRYALSFENLSTSGKVLCVNETEMNGITTRSTPTTRQTIPDVTSSTEVMNNQTGTSQRTSKHIEAEYEYLYVPLAAAIGVILFVAIIVAIAVVGIRCYRRHHVVKSFDRLNGDT